MRSESCAAREEETTRPASDKQRATRSLLLRHESQALMLSQAGTRVIEFPHVVYGTASMLADKTQKTSHQSPRSVHTYSFPFVFSASIMIRSNHRTQTTVISKDDLQPTNRARTHSSLLLISPPLDSSHPLQTPCRAPAAPLDQSGCLTAPHEPVAKHQIRVRSSMLFHRELNVQLCSACLASQRFQRGEARADGRRKGPSFVKNFARHRSRVMTWFLMRDGWSLLRS